MSLLVPREVLLLVDVCGAGGGVQQMPLQASEPAAYKVTLLLGYWSFTPPRCRPRPAPPPATRCSASPAPSPDPASFSWVSSRQWGHSLAPDRCPCPPQCSTLPSCCCCSSSALETVRPVGRAAGLGPLRAEKGPCPAPRGEGQDREQGKTQGLTVKVGSGGQSWG